MKPSVIAGYMFATFAMIGLVCLTLAMVEWQPYNLVYRVGTHLQAFHLYLYGFIVADLISVGWLYTCIREMGRGN